MNSAHYPNRYPGVCLNCQQPVPADSGECYRGPDGDWRVICAECIIDPDRELPWPRCGVIPASYYPDLGLVLCRHCMYVEDERRYRKAKAKVLYRVGR